ncbi:MAG TPA: hypothetical protein VKB75_01930 [Jatrophihabitans sp.]|nr:hypothetical protein [Jatrophihabitans sp.]
MIRDLLLPAESAADPGVTGNSRLTASTGVVLTVLLVIEGFTILDVRGYITLHTVIGLLLVGPLVLKCATTMYRFARYYRGAPAYVGRGAPPLLLRALGPLVVLSSLAVLGSGVALIAVHGRDGGWLTLHKASFIVWIVVTGVHFLGHLFEAVLGTARDLSRNAAPAVRGRAIRLSSVALSLAVGVALAAAFTPSASSWHMNHNDQGHFRDH